MQLLLPECWHHQSRRASGRRPPLSSTALAVRSWSARYIAATAAATQQAAGDKRNASEMGHLTMISGLLVHRTRCKACRPWSSSPGCTRLRLWCLCDPPPHPRCILPSIGRLKGVRFWCLAAVLRERECLRLLLFVVVAVVVFGRFEASRGCCVRRGRVLAVPRFLRTTLGFRCGVYAGIAPPT